MDGPHHLTCPLTPCLKHVKEHDQHHYNRTSSMVSCCRIESQFFRSLERRWCGYRQKQGRSSRGGETQFTYPELHWKPRVGQIVEGCENQAMASLRSERRVYWEVNRFFQLETSYAPGRGLCLVRCLGFNNSRVCELRLKGRVCESWQCPVLNPWPKGEPLRIFHSLSKVDSGFSRLFVFILNSISDS